MKIKDLNTLGFVESYKAITTAGGLPTLEIAALANQRRKIIKTAEEFQQAEKEIKEKYAGKVELRDKDFKYTGSPCEEEIKLLEDKEISFDMVDITANKLPKELLNAVITDELRNVINFK